MKSISKFEQVPVEKLVPYARNARVHGEKQILQLRSSLREFGFIAPIIIDKKFNIIAGHARFEAAKAESMTEVPCIFAEHLTETQKKAYIITDNKLALNSEWDDEILALEFEELKESDFNLNLLGFDEKEIEKYFNSGAADGASGQISGENSFTYKEQYGVIVMCSDENNQREVYEKLLEMGYECKVVAT